MTVSEDFTGLTGGFRGELLAHCYRMLGSAGEAEDLVQETYLRAWRSFDGFEGRSSVRTWLYRIATNVCLTAIERRSLAAAAVRAGRSGGGPGRAGRCGSGCAVAAAVSRRAVRLPNAGIRRRWRCRGRISGWPSSRRCRYLSARQRAVLILRDVLDWPGCRGGGSAGHDDDRGEQRAAAGSRPSWPGRCRPKTSSPSPANRTGRALLDRFAAALQNADASALAELLREDASLEMPPAADLVHRPGTPWPALPGVAAVLAGPGRLRLVPVTANGQPAFAVYQREPDGEYRAHAVLVLTLTTTGIARIVAFQDPGLFGSFGLPQEYPAAGLPPAQGPTAGVAPLSPGGPSGGPPSGTVR